MATPIVEQIADELKTAVEVVTTAGGYELDLTEVVRQSRLNNPTIRHLTVVQRQGLSTRATEHDALTGGVHSPAWSTPFMFDIYIRKDAKDASSIDEDINIARSDVEKALGVGFVNGGTLDDLTIDYDFTPHEELQDETGEFAGITVGVDVIWRTPENDPYTNAP